MMMNIYKGLKTLSRACKSESEPKLAHEIRGGSLRMPERLWAPDRCGRGSAPVLRISV